MTPSCLTLTTRCGPDGISCCDSRPVDGGAYTRSYEDATGSAEQRRAIVNDFWLDTYEITVGRFREFIEAGERNAERALPRPAPESTRRFLTAGGRTASGSSSSRTRRR